MCLPHCPCLQDAAERGAAAWPSSATNSRVTAEPVPSGSSKAVAAAAPGDLEPVSQVVQAAGSHASPPGADSKAAWGDTGHGGKQATGGAQEAERSAISGVTLGPDGE